MFTVQIQEENCVGCTKCIAVCPVDAIVGASGMMHSVLTDECIGCRLCIDPCPMDCIEIVPPTQESAPVDKQARATKAKKRVQERLARLSREKQLLLLPPITKETQTQMHLDIQAALARANQKQATTVYKG
ncbi:MAG: hypothetical protein RLZ35_878 [Pseudomonadota bacterium]|jgi:electron transport complex protein RnfB